MLFSNLRGQFFWHSLSSEEACLSGDEQVSLTSGPVVILPFVVPLIFRLPFECVARVNAPSVRGENTDCIQQQVKNTNTVLQQEHLTVSILSAIVYSWGGFGIPLCQTALHHVLSRKMTYCVTLVYLRNVQLFTYRISVYFVSEHLCYSYAVFFTQLWPMDAMIGLFISFDFQQVFSCLFYATEDCRNIV